MDSEDDPQRLDLPLRSDATSTRASGCDPCIFISSAAKPDAEMIMITRVGDHLRPDQL